MAKKRTQAAAGIRAEDEGRSTKKRKAARASEAKTRQMTDAAAESELESDEEVIRSGQGRGKKKGKSKEQRVEDMPLFAPGLRLFEGFSDTIRNTEIAALTKTEPDMDQSRKYGFTLKPLIPTEGPLAGQTILVLQHTATFRFLDLPPEIRNMIYGLLIDQRKAVTISSYKPIGKERRPMPLPSTYGGYVNRRAHTRDWKNGKLLDDQPHPRPHNLLRVCKQLQDETGFLLYGETTFSFYNWSDANLFLGGFGSMRRFLRRIQFPTRSKGFSKSRSVIKKVQDATDLQSFTIDHSKICPSARYRGRGWYGIVNFVHAVKPVLSALQKRGIDGGDLLDIFKVGAHPASTFKCSHCGSDTDTCYSCRMGILHNKICFGNGQCKTDCKDLQAHCDDLDEELRAALAKTLGIEE